jgi:hypothetical protein
MNYADVLAIARGLILTTANMNMSNEAAQLKKFNDNLISDVAALRATNINVLLKESAENRDAYNELCGNVINSFNDLRNLESELLAVITAVVRNMDEY